MFKLLKSLFSAKPKESLSDVPTKESEAEEKKKCKNCLRRSAAYVTRCQFCDSTSFYDE